MDLQLSGKTALITGSSKGIGEAIARQLAAEGASVIVHGRDQALTERVATDIVSQGGIAYAVHGDLTSDQQVLQLMHHAVQAAGQIDILINNAGGSGGVKQSWTDTVPAAWLAAFDRNVLAALRVSTAALPGMKLRQWGRIINISSLAASMPPPSAPDYSASKAAVNAMTASMAKACAADGVTVNAVSPGTIHSATLDARFRAVAAQRELAPPDAPWQQIESAVLPLFAQVPMGRVGRVEDIAAAVAFLASPLAAYISGINLRVDGAMSPVL
jgi:NAD(P)-dependent dehydrogenase (short-subunit alcohol dehydrogenase family)